MVYLTREVFKNDTLRARNQQVYFDSWIIFLKVALSEPEINRLILAVKLHFENKHFQGQKSAV